MKGAHHTNGLIVSTISIFPLTMSNVETKEKTKGRLDKESDTDPHKWIILLIACFIKLSTDEEEKPRKKKLNCTALGL